VSHSVSRYVVDANVAVKWFLPEVHDIHARRLLAPETQLLAPETQLLAPDLLFPEVGNILWKRVRSGQITETEADTVLQALGALPLLISPSWPLVAAALAIACPTDRSVYDSLYLALAVQESAPLVTADEKFYNALKGGPLAPSLLWVEDIPG
jgi:predicted nucleic acid-binding protein